MEWWISSRSGWLLELLTELTIGETTGITIGITIGISRVYLGYILGISWIYHGHTMSISWEYQGISQHILGMSGANHWHVGHNLAYLGHILGIPIPLICHGSHEYTRVNFFWPV